MPTARLVETYVTRAASVAAVALTAALAAALGGCHGIGAEGIDPPADRIFFPSALTVDATSRWLYVVNSNSDLRYNRGTVVAVDLQRVARDRAPDVALDWPVCPTPRYYPKTAPVLNCCRDVIDQRVLNCDERAYIHAPSTARIGSFGAAILKQPYERDGQPIERLFVAVRSDPSVTFIDSWSAGDEPHLRCSGSRSAALTELPAADQECEEAWRIESGTRGTETLMFPEEPFDLVLDSSVGALYTAHLFTGVSVIDACAPESGRAPALAWIQRALFPNLAAQGVTAVSLAPPGDARASLYATSRASSSVASLVLDGAGPVGDACGAVGEGPRALSLSPSSMTLMSNTFYPGGNDVRGFVLEPGGNRGYLLHRNTSRGPSAVVRFDRIVDGRGVAAFTPVAEVEVCSGPTQLVEHDAGRGRRFFVPCFEAGQVYVIDPVEMAVEATIDLGRGPTRITFDPANPAVAYVAGFSDNDVSVVDLQPTSATEYRVRQRIGFPRPASAR